jgi:hypothetical protein
MTQEIRIKQLAEAIVIYLDCLKKKRVASMHTRAMATLDLPLHASTEHRYEFFSFFF